MILVHLNQAAIDALAAQSLADGHEPAFKDAGMYPLGGDVLDVLAQRRQSNETISDVIVRLLHEEG